MRFGEGTIGLSRVHVDLLIGTPWEGHRAFGSTALLGLVCEASAKADVKLLKFICGQGSEGVTVDDLRIAQLLEGDNYITVPDIGRTREMLDELFAEYLVDDPLEVSTDQSIINREAARDALIELELS